MTHWGEGFRIENLEVDSKGIYKLDFITHNVRNLEPTRWGHVALSWRINIEGRGDAQNSIGGDFKLSNSNCIQCPGFMMLSNYSWFLFWLVFVIKCQKYCTAVSPSLKKQSWRWGREGIYNESHDKVSGDGIKSIPRCNKKSDGSQDSHRETKYLKWTLPIIAFRICQHA